MLTESLAKARGSENAASVALHYGCKRSRSSKVHGATKYVYSKRQGSTRLCGGKAGLVPEVKCAATLCPVVPELVHTSSDMQLVYFSTASRHHKQQND